MSTLSESMAAEIRKAVIKMQQRGTNVGSAMSVADILAVLYFDVMHIPSPQDPGRDRLVFSKGHAASALYAALALKGFLDAALLETFLLDGSDLTGHPCQGGAAGVDVSTGSLGHGLPIAVGMALAAKRDGRDPRVFVVQGCGEMQEGSVWEGAMLASRLALDNLIVIVDANNLQGYGRAEDIQPIETFAPKLRAFGWSVEEVDGHDHAALSTAFKRTPNGKPAAVVARTIKGKGVAEMEDVLGWHYFSVPPDKVQPFLDELDGGR